MGLCSAMAQAQNAEAALKKTVEKVTQSQSVSGKFRIVASDGNAAAGDILISKQRFAMTSGDFGVWYDGSDMWSYYKQMGDVSLTQPTASELMEVNPFDILNNYREIYTAKIVKSEVVGTTRVEFLPKRKSCSVARAILVIDNASDLPLSIDATFANGTSVKVTLSDIKIGQTAPAKSAFIFPSAKYPGVEVVDLR